MKRAREEQDLLARVSALCQDEDAITVDMALLEIREYGFEPLVSALGSYDQPTGRALLSRTVFMSLYTLGMKAKEAAPKNREALAQAHDSMIKEYLTTVVLPTLNGKHGELLLGAFVRQWSNHRMLTEWMKRMFKFVDLDAARAGASKRDATLTSHSLKLFKALVFDKKKATLASTVVQLINRERQGEAVNRAMIKTAVSMFLVIGICQQDDKLAGDDDVERKIQGQLGATNPVYASEFEGPFLDATRTFYRAKAEQWLYEDSMSEYLQKVEQVYDTEGSRVDAYLHASTKPKLREVCRMVLLQEFMKELLEREGSGMRSVLRDLPPDGPLGTAGGAGGGAPDPGPHHGRDKRGDLRRMFALFRELPGGVAAMGELFREHVDAEGMGLVQKRVARCAAAAEEPVEAASGKPKGLSPYDPDYIDELIRFWGTYNSLIKSEFGDNQEMHASCRRALEKVLNTAPGDRSHAELVCTYMDAVLRGKHGSESLEEARIDELTRSCVELFRYLADKDVFRDVYRALLAKRLLLQKSVSMDAERGAITQLKHACGPQFTYRIEGMVSDLALAKDFDKLYRDHTVAVGAYGSLGVEDFHAQVLKTGYWPGFTILQSVTIPPEMARPVQQFQSFFTSREPSKKLTWVWSQGMSTLRVDFVDGWKDVVVTTLQAMVALWFNTSAAITVNDLATITNIDKSNLKRIIAPMCCAKGFKVIRKTPPSPVIKDDDLLEFDYTYRHPKREVTLPFPSLQENKKVDAIPGEERKESVDAAIVRIMKARKRMTHTDLVQEVGNQIKFFRPDARLIKNRIDVLMNSYIRREDPMSISSPYLYVAGEEV